VDGIHTYSSLKDEQKLGVQQPWHGLVRTPASLHLLGFFEGFVDGTDHVESLLWQMVTLASHNHLEAANGFGQADVLAG
jgi:hypothetical protein